MNKAVFKTLEGFLQHRLADKDAWSQVMMNAGVEPKAEMRLDEETGEALLESAADLCGVGVGEMLEASGRHAAPGLLDRLRLRRPESVSWKVLDVVENLPDLLRGLEKNAEVPPIETRALRLRLAEAAMVVLRPRRVCHLVKGILLGIAEKGGEPLYMEEHLCQWQGSMLCRFRLTLNDPMLIRAVDVRREFEAARSREDVIRIYNRFQGVPVVSEGEILRIGADEVTFRLSHAQLLAMQMEESSFLAVPHFNTGLKARVKSLDLTDSSAVLHAMEITDGMVGLREAERVEPLYPVMVEFDLGEQVMRGQLVDVSVGGLSMVVRQDAYISEEDLFSPVELRFKLQNAPPVMRRGNEKLKHAIRWMDGDLAGESQEVSVAGNVMDLTQDNDVKLVRVVFSAPPEEALNLLHSFVSERCETVYQSMSGRGSV